METKQSPHIEIQQRAENNQIQVHLNITKNMGKSMKSIQRYLCNIFRSHLQNKKITDSADHRKNYF